MKNHQKQWKFTLVFDGIRVAFSHPLGLTEHVKVKSMDVKHTAELIETMKWKGGEATVRREEDMCKWNRRKIVTAGQMVGKD